MGFPGEDWAGVRRRPKGGTTKRLIPQKTKKLKEKRGKENPKTERGNGQRIPNEAVAQVRWVFGVPCHPPGHSLRSPELGKNVTPTVPVGLVHKVFDAANPGATMKNENARGGTGLPFRAQETNPGRGGQNFPPF